jgi:hypothetical protein
MSNRVDYWGYTKETTQRIGLWGWPCKIKRKIALFGNISTNLFKEAYLGCLRKFSMSYTS